MVIEVKTDDSVFMLINIYNATTESEQLHTLNDLLKRLDYFFISNSLQESIKTRGTLAAFSTDHSLITFCLFHFKKISQGKGLWKFNKSLINNENYSEQIKMLIKNVLNNLNQDNIVDPQFVRNTLNMK